MADKIVLPSNLEDEQILKRFLGDLLFSLNSNPFFAKRDTSELANYIANLNDAAAVNPNFAKTVAKLRELQADIKAYVEQNIETKILQNSEDVALVAEQFGTFYDQALAAAWYGLTVKAGNVISGFTVGSIDTDTTTPGTEGSFFAINTDTFSVAKAIEDISDPAELSYLQAHNLPYGTMYNTSTEEIIPAFTINWTGTEYLIDFNGIVSFNNVTDTESVALAEDIYVPGTTTIDGGNIAADSIYALQINVDDVFAQDITATGTITGGTLIGVDLKEVTSGSYYTAVYPQSDSTHMIGGYRFGGFSSRTTDASYQYISSGLFGFYSYNLGGSASDLNRCKSDTMPIDIRIEFSENNGQIYNIGQLEVRSYDGTLLVTPISWNFADTWFSQSFTQNGLTFRGRESVTDNLTAISISGVYNLSWSGKSYKDIYLQLVLNDPSFEPDRCVIEATAYTR